MPDIVGLDPVRRSFARLFIALRGRAGRTQNEAATALEVSRPTITRIEDAQDGVKLTNLMVNAMADFFKADMQERQLLLALAAETRSGRQKPWFEDYTATELPTWFSLYLSLEGIAECVRVHAVELIPGLLQDASYARAVVNTSLGFGSVDEVERRLQARLERQTLLTRKDTSRRFDTIGSEGMLHRQVGGPKIMIQQLEKILAMTELDNISFRVITFEAGVHAGMGASEFTILEFPNHSPAEIVEPPLVYVETLTGAMYAQKDNEAQAYRSLWRDMENRALSEKETRAMVEKKRTELMRL